MSYSQRFIGCLFNLTKGSPVWRRGIEWSGKCKSPHANGEMPWSVRKCHENLSNIFKQRSTQHCCLALQLQTKFTISNLPGKLEVIMGIMRKYCQIWARSTCGLLQSSEHLHCPKWILDISWRNTSKSFKLLATQKVISSATRNAISLAKGSLLFHAVLAVLAVLAVWPSGHPAYS